MFQIFELDQTDSTNNYANYLLAKNNISGNTAIWAHHQTKGRGQQGNNWHSEPNANLTFSLVYFPRNLKIFRQFFMLQAISLAVCDFLNSKNIISTIKWPNDIYVNDQKICGILIESACMDDMIHSVVAGIGVNVNQTCFDASLPNPTSMQLQTKQFYDIKNSLTCLLECLKNRLKQLELGELDELADNYTEKLYRINNYYWFEDKNGKFKAKITGIEETGELKMIDELNNERLYLFKEVSYLL